MNKNIRKTQSTRIALRLMALLLLVICIIFSSFNISFATDSKDFLEQTVTSGGYSFNDRKLSGESYIYFGYNPYKAGVNYYDSYTKIETGINLGGNFSKQQSVSSYVVSQTNSGSNRYDDSLLISSDKEFRLEYLSATIYVYKDGVEKAIELDDCQITTGSISLLSYQQQYDSVFVQVTARVNYLGDYFSSPDDLKYRTVDKNVSTAGKSGKAKSTALAWNFLQKNVSTKAANIKATEYITGKNGKYSMTTMAKNKKQTDYLKKEAQRITKNQKNNYDRLIALTEALANRVYYNYANIKGANVIPYDVWTKKTTVCTGYANTAFVMLNSIGIPTLVIYGDNHAYNASYIKEKKRWVFYDVTWMSGNNYYGKKDFQKGNIEWRWFDMPYELLLKNSGHEIYRIGGIVNGNVSYALVLDGNSQNRKKQANNYAKPSSWYITPETQIKKSSTLKIAAKVGGYQVKKIEEYAFFDQKNISKIYIPKTVKSIGKGAFHVNGRFVKTKVYTKLKRSKLFLDRAWGNRRITIRKY